MRERESDRTQKKKWNVVEETPESRTGRAWIRDQSEETQARDKADMVVTRRKVVHPIWPTRSIFNKYYLLDVRG